MKSRRESRDHSRTRAVRFSSRIVTLGRHTGSDYEILEGLGEGEKIVTKGHTSLRNGSEVNVIN